MTISSFSQRGMHDASAVVWPRRAFLQSLILMGLTMPCSALAADQRGRGLCSAAPVRLKASGPLKRTAARLRAKLPVQVLAIGSSSTQGIGASSPAFSYPAQLESALELRFPGVDVRVVNAGIAGETADRTLARLDAELERTKPDLVLWQVGTNDALSSSVTEPAFEATVERGVTSIERHKSDVLLLDQQFTKKVNDPDRYERFVLVLDRVARKDHVCLFPRYRLMKMMDQFDGDGIELMLAADGFHMNDAGYACVANLLALNIQELVAQPDQ
jgi:acyl-CoA thioesterase-1